MQLQYLSIPALIGAAGGDPWAINQSPQAGSPLQISNLAEAPVDRAHIWLKALPGPVVNPALAGQPAPLTGIRRGR